VGALFTFSTTIKPAVRLGTGIPLMLLMIGLGIFFMARPIPVSNEQANPIPPNSESVAAGQALFMTTCALCHGVTGKGDGPVGLTLNPRPADLSQHAIPGIHTDAQLFEWITNGFPGSRMPAFKSALSDTDRWNLVNFIRTLAPK
jgi:mono/diheme cytochrome c family protein